MIIVGCCGFCTSMDNYFRKYKAIEVQKTFYKPPRVETAKRWREKALAINPDFEFTIKAWQVITHPPSSPTYRKAGLNYSGVNCGYFRLSEAVIEAWEKTREIADVLRAKIIVFQTPPSFRETEENSERVVQFFSTIGSLNYTFVWEPRGWSLEGVRRVCERVNLVHCVDPFAENPALERDVSYFRLHGYGLNCREGKYGRLNYKHVYDDRELEWLKDYVTKVGSEKTYVMFNNTAMCRDAERFEKLLKNLKD